MKLKNYKELFEKYESYDDEDDFDDEDDLDDEDDDYYGRPSYSTKDESDDVISSDMEHLLYLLRTFFKNSGVEVQMQNKGLDISIVSVLNKKEKISGVIKVFDVIKKLKRDILPQYDSEFEMWETKDGRPLLTFNFYYGEGLEDDEEAF